MPFKPHPTDPDKMVYASRQYDIPDTPTARAYLQKVLDDDDDIQVYKRPWVDLTDESVTQVIDLMPNGINGWMSDWDLYEFARAVLAKSKEKNT